MNYKIDHDYEIDEIPNEVNGNFYVRLLPQSLQFKIRKAAAIKASLFFKKAHDKSIFVKENNKVIIY